MLYPRACARGFTLLEVLIATTLGALLMCSLWQAWSIARKALDDADDRMERAGTARAALEMITRELAGAVVDEAAGVSFLGNDRGERGIKTGCADEVFFVAPIAADLAGAKAATELYRFGYWLKCDSGVGVLERAYQGPARGGERYGFTKVSSQPLADGVSDLRLRYLYADGAWQETAGGTWDSVGDCCPADGEPDGLPAAVRVRLTVRDRRGGSETFAVVVPLMTSGVKR